MPVEKLYVKTGFTQLNDPDLEKDGNKKWKALELNTNFPGMIPNAAAISLSIKDATTAFHDSRIAVPYSSAFKDEKRDELIVAMNNGASTIQLNHGNVLSKLLSTGYEAKDTEGTPVGPLPVVGWIKMRTPYDAASGTMLVFWEGVEHADGYMLEFTQDPAPAFKPTPKFVSATEFLLSGLTPGQLLYARVAPVGTDPSLNFCEIISKFVQ